MARRGGRWGLRGGARALGEGLDGGFAGGGLVGEQGGVGAGPIGERKALAIEAGAVGLKGDGGSKAALQIAFGAGGGGAVLLDAGVGDHQKGGAAKLGGVFNGEAIKDLGGLGVIGGAPDLGDPLCDFAGGEGGDAKGHGGQAHARGVGVDQGAGGHALGGARMVKAQKFNGDQGWGGHEGSP